MQKFFFDWCNDGYFYEVILAVLHLCKFLDCRDFHEIMGGEAGDNHAVIVFGIMRKLVSL